MSGILRKVTVSTNGSPSSPTPASPLSPRSLTQPPPVLINVDKDKKDQEDNKSNDSVGEEEMDLNDSLTSEQGNSPATTREERMKERKMKRLSRTMKRSLSNLSIKKASVIVREDNNNNASEDPGAEEKDKEKEKEKEKSKGKKKKEEKQREKEEKEKLKKEEKELEKQKEKEEKEKLKREKEEKKEKKKESKAKKHHKEKPHKEKGDKKDKKKEKKKEDKDDEHDKDKEQKKAEREAKVAAKKAEKERAHAMKQSIRRTKKNAQVFGVSLRIVLKENPQCGIPPFVEQACLYVEQTMLDFEGIFRKTGTREECKRWRDLINTVGYMEWGKLKENITACDLLKLYLRELPDPLLTYELYDCFLAKAKSFRTTDMLLNLRGMVDLLPSSNLRLLKRIIITLRKVREHAEKNLMDENNLGVIFGPNLLRAPADSKADLMVDFEYVNAITLSLIVDYDALLGSVAYKPYYLCHVRVVQDYTPLSPGELPLKKGDVVTVTVTDKSGWWLGELSNEIGRFPIYCCTFLNGTPCKDGYEPFNIEACTDDGSAPRETRVVDAKSVSSLSVKSGGHIRQRSDSHEKEKSPRITLPPLSASASLPQSLPSQSSPRLSHLQTPSSPSSHKAPSSPRTPTATQQTTTTTQTPSNEEGGAESDDSSKDGPEANANGSAEDLFSFG